jgi:methane/ammonia monooxygenase subunit A
MGAMVLDAMLVLTRSWLLTGVFGGALFGLLFMPSNWIYMAPYFQPVEHMGQMTSLADLIGYTFPRSGTPEYIRIIERGTLRTFQDSAMWVSAFFSAFICIFVYMMFWWLGIAATITKYIPVGAKFKGMFGAHTAEKGAAS